MDTSNSVLLDRARRVRQLADVFEVVGWLGVVGSVVLALFVATQDTYGVEGERTQHVIDGLVVGILGVLGSLAEVLVARGFSLFAVYAARAANNFERRTTPIESDRPTTGGASAEWITTESGEVVCRRHMRSSC